MKVSYKEDTPIIIELSRAEAKALLLILKAIPSSEGMRNGCEIDDRALSDLCTEDKVNYDAVVSPLDNSLYCLLSDFIRGN